MTQGYACPQRSCPYYGIADARIHALVGDGHHGTTDHIQDLRCQACGTKVTTRRGTPLYHLRTPPQRVGEVLSTLAEGLDAQAAARVFGHREAPIRRWLGCAGRPASHRHAQLFQELALPHVQLDEIRTRLRQRCQVLWLWLVIDPVTKIVPVLHLGPRTQESAHAVVHGRRTVLAPGCVPVITSAGLRQYFYAVTAHFGWWRQGSRCRVWQVAPALVYGQVQKVYRRRRLVRVRHRMLCGTRKRLQTTLQGLGRSGRLTTAFIERLNLTARHGVAALSRRTWATAQTAPGLLLQVEWWRLYYHLVRPHSGLQVALPHPQPREGRRVPQRYRVRTPAMAAGVTLHRWHVVEVLRYPCASLT
jgi:IS1 family transposase